MEEISVQRVVDTILKNFLNIILVAIIAICVGLIYSIFIVDRQYQSNSTVVIPKSGLVEEYSKLIKTETVLSSICQEYNIGFEELKDNVTVDLSNKKAYSIKILVTNESAETSKKLANEIANKFVNVLRYANEVSNAKVSSQKAEIPTEYYNFSTKIVIKNCIKLLAILECVYIFVILAIEFFSTKIKTEYYLKNELKYNVIGNISSDESPNVIKKQPLYYNLQCNNLVNRIRHIFEDDEGKAVILMANAAESKVDYNHLLDAFVKTNKKILLIYLNSNSNCEFKIEPKSKFRNLKITQISEKSKLQTQIEENREKYDYILVVSHQIDGLNVQEDILPLFKNIILFVKYGKTRIDDIIESRKILERYNKFERATCVTIGKSYLEDIIKYVEFLKTMK